MAQKTYLTDKRFGYDYLCDWFESYKIRGFASDGKFSNAKDYLQELERRVNEELPGSFVWQMKTKSILCDTDEKEKLPRPMFYNFITKAIKDIDEERTKEDYDYGKE